MSSDPTPPGLARLAARLRLEIVDLNTVPPEVASRLETLLDVFYSLADNRASNTKPGHYVEIGFVANHNYSAFAWKDEHDVIGIYFGTFYILNNMFRRVLSHPKFFTMLGNSSEEIAERAVIDSHGLPLREYFSVSPVVNPVDPLRLSFANWLADLAIIHVFQHELGHIWNGHVDLALTRGRADQFNEMDLARTSGLKPIDLQTLEMDADSYATANILHHAQFVLAQNKDLFAPGIEDWPITKELGLDFTAWALGIAALHFSFRIFEEENYSEETVAERSHPPAPVRSNICANVAIAALMERQGRSGEEADKIAAWGISIGEQWFCTITGQAFDENFRAEWSEKSGPFQLSYLRHWHKLYPELDQLKRGGNIPPPQDWVFEVEKLG